MRRDYSIYDALYEEAKRKGWSGWGGDGRIACGPGQLQRIFEKPYVPKTGRALELGCGEGHLCRLLSRRGFEVTGIDVSKVALDWVKEKQPEVPVAYVHADLSLPGVLEGEQFDLVVDGNCLHCILGEDRVAFLNNVHRLLSNGGIFFVSSLCAQGAAPVITEHAGQPWRFVPSVEYLLQELDQAKFAILDWEVRQRDAFDHINVFARCRTRPPCSTWHNHLRARPESPAPVPLQVNH
ncbi:MAG: class I SAM-dependent methyltransferase [Brachymonas sp.]|nr:class I SAM-dependent methyltransferase [Brachymonas sp.]